MFLLQHDYAALRDMWFSQNGEARAGKRWKVPRHLKSGDGKNIARNEKARVRDIPPPMTKWSISTSGRREMYFFDKSSAMRNPRGIEEPKAIVCGQP